MEHNLITAKSGYLNNDFKLFHITDKNDQTFEFHYHEFNKIIIFLSGNVTYLIEGKSYQLKPWDILLINHHDVHKPIIAPNETYDRIIIWADSDFIKNHNYENCDLTTCFKLADTKSFNLIRIASHLQEKLKEIILGLDHSFHSSDFGSKLLSNAFFIELLVYMNRVLLENTNVYEENTQDTDQQIEAILLFVKKNLSFDLSIDTIAKEFFMSKHYLMHKFKNKTGYTLHNYILKKRLFKSVDLIKEGVPISKAAELSGFNDYTSFLRSFKKTFHQTPRDFL